MSFITSSLYMQSSRVALSNSMYASLVLSTSTYSWSRCMAARHVITIRCAKRAPCSIRAAKLYIYSMDAIIITLLVTAREPTCNALRISCFSRDGISSNSSATNELDIRWKSGLMTGDEAAEAKKKHVSCLGIKIITWKMRLTLTSGWSQCTTRVNKFGSFSIQLLLFGRQIAERLQILCNGHGEHQIMQIDGAILKDGL